MLIFEEGGKPENPKKTLGARTRTNNKLNPHMTPGPGIEPGTHLWEASALTTAPSLLPVNLAGELWRGNLVLNNNPIFFCKGVNAACFVVFSFLSIIQEWIY